MGAAHGKLSEADIGKGRKVINKLGGYLRKEQGISDQREEASLGALLTSQTGLPIH